jgi:hypothetical protein
VTPIIQNSFPHYAQGSAPSPYLLPVWKNLYLQVTISVGQDSLGFAIILFRNVPDYISYSSWSGVLFFSSTVWSNQRSTRRDGEQEDRNPVW